MRPISFCTAILLLATAAVGQTASVRVLYNFTVYDVNDAYYPVSGVLQAANGNDYGLMNEDGIFFALQPNGGFSEPTTLDPRSAYSYSDLIQGPDGDFYFTSTGYYAADSCGGAGCGYIGRITPTGLVTVLHSLGGTDGASPLGPLTLGADGNFYGTASQGGDASGCITGYRVPGCGTLFRITPSGEFTVLYTFTGGADGGVPGMNLLQASDGNFYGVTQAGGTGSCTGCGVAYQLTPGGKYTVVVDFPTPVIEQFEDYQSELSEGKDGALYGVGLNKIYKIAPGTGYSLVWQDPSNTNVIDSEGLFPASDGKLYGFDGGLFSLTTAGSVQPFAGVSGTAVTQAADGGFLGVSPTLGANDNGFIYEVDDNPPLPAPVQLSLTPSTVSAGLPVEASLQVLNAFSVSMQQCYAFTTNNGVTTPLGKVPGMYNSQTKIYGANVAFTPTSAGTFNFAVTCGGIESGYAGLTVNANATTTTLSASSDTVTPPASDTLSATVTREVSGNPTGTVTFYDGALVVGTAPLENGTATLAASSKNVPAGQYSITAKYSGDAGDDASTSNSVAVTVE